MDKLSSPAAERNREPILRVLEVALGDARRVLEIASGSGQHAAFFARHLPHLIWQPSDPDPAARASIAVWAADEGLANLRPPLELDVRRQPWPIADADADAVVNINMLHISPWECCEALFSGAAALPACATIVLYGPFRIADRPTAPSNEAFDRSLRERDPSWGLRWLHDVETVARRHRFALERTVDMPANNVSVVFRRGLAASA